MILAVTSFLAGFFAAAIVCKLAHTDKIDRIKQDAKNALEKQATESFQAGYMRCYAEENRRKAKKIDKDVTAILDLIS